MFNDGLAPWAQTAHQFMYDEVLPRKLTPRQERFVEAYLVTLSATKAAKLAGYSERSAGKIGSRLLNENPLVRECVARRRSELTAATGLTPERVVLELMDNARRAKQRSGTSLVTSMQCWELLGRHIGLFPRNPRLTPVLVGGVVEKSGKVEGLQLGVPMPSTALPHGHEAAEGQNGAGGKPVE
jgi:phage terminase small subunit